MGRRARKGESKQPRKASLPVEDERALLDPTERSFIYDAVDEYHDDEDEEGETSSHKIIRQDKKKEQVLSLGNLSSDDEDESEGLKSDEELFMSDSDIVDERQEKVEDERDWGRKKRLYYGTDLTDERLFNEMNSNRKGQSERLELELEGVQKFQGRMLEEVKDLTFSMPPEFQKVPETKKQDLWKVDRKEIKSHLSDLKNKAYELQLIFEPLVGLIKRGLLPESLFADYITVKYQITLNYLCILSSFMMIAASDEDLENHPVWSRIAQYKRLFKELEACDEKFAPQLQKCLKMLESEKSNFEKLFRDQKISKSEVKMDDQYEDDLRSDENDFTSVVSSIKEQEEDEAEGDDRRRLITKEMIKNKGLIPSRRKDQKNPRVKYKMKYKNKLKRRKGQIREVRKEINRYQGETSGIKAYLVKSTKLK